MVEGEECSKCRFYLPEVDDVGLCARYAPRPFTARRPVDSFDYVDALWPFVNSNDWCGEFLSRTDRPSDSREGT